MKNTLPFFLFFCLIGGTYSQDFETQTIRNDFDYLEVQIRCISAPSLPTTSTDITDLQLMIRWPLSYGADVSTTIICSNYSLVPGMPAIHTKGTFYYQVYTADPAPLQPATNWGLGQWETIASIAINATSNSGIGSFETAPDGWEIYGLNIGIDGVDHTPAVHTSVSDLPYPTEIYDFVWMGGSTLSGYDESSWTLGTNWADPCGTIYDVQTIPNVVNNCIIPGGLSYYPSNFNNQTNGFCYVLRIQNGAIVTIPNSIQFVAGKLRNQAGSSLEVENGGELTVDD